jgi:DNA-binding response OmpR family regulator
MKKVLIVDDEPSIIMSLDFLMRKAGYSVMVARDGNEAIRHVDQDEPDVVVLDIMMPLVDGYEVCEYIKKKKKLDSKVIFLTAKSREEDIEKGFAAGADDYMTKPFSTKKLVEKVKQLIDKNPHSNE